MHKDVSEFIQSRHHFRRLHNRRVLSNWTAQAEHANGDSFKNLLVRFGERTSTHGLNHLLASKNRKMRLIWLLAFLVALSMLIYICYLLAQRYQRKQFQTVIASTTWPIYEISFPVIIICNKNRLNWSRLTEVKQLYNISAKQEILFEKILTAYDGLSFRYFDLFDFLQNETLTDLNHINFTTILEYMAWRCNEIFENCYFQMVRYNCCEIFQPRRQQMGSCLSFNEDKNRHSAESGSGTGLKVNLRLRKALHAPNNPASKGFLINILEPHVWTDYYFDLVPFANTDIGLGAIYHFFDNNTRAVSYTERQCVFEDEHNIPEIITLQGQKYMQENCMSECQQRHLLKYCNCTFDLFYPPSGYRACKLVDLPCLAMNNNFMDYQQPDETKYVKSPHPGIICNCFRNCYSLVLNYDVRTNPITDNDRAAIDDYVNLNVYYNKNTILVYKTTLIYTWVDLLVSFGGIFELCLGCSLISLFELGYFNCVNIPAYLLRRLSYWRRRQHSTSNSTVLLHNNLEMKY